MSGARNGRSGAARVRDVLVVDDEPGMRETVRDLLSLVGIEAETAADGLEALELFRRGRYRWVIMDVMMPRMNGVEALKRMRAARPETTFVLMTGWSDSALLEEARRNGCRQVLPKPLDIPQLLRLFGAEPEALAA